MPTKFSNITPAGSPPAATDSVVAVTGGSTDSLVSMMQLSATPPNTQSGTTYTLVLTDAGGIVEMSSASSNTVTIPPNSSVAFIVGTRITVVQTGAGTTTIAGGSGVTLLGSVLSTAGQYAGITFYQRAANSWVVLQ